MPTLICLRYIIFYDWKETSLIGSTYFTQIELKAEDLYDKEKVDLETIIIDDVFTLLQCDDKGLDSEEAARRIGLFGPNKLESEEQNAFLQVRASSRHKRPKISEPSH